MTLIGFLIDFDRSVMKWGWLLFFYWLIIYEANIIHIEWLMDFKMKCKIKIFGFLNNLNLLIIQSWIFESFKDKLSCNIKLNCWDDTCDKLQENKQSIMRPDFLIVFTHGIRHWLQNICMFTRVDCW